MVVKLKYIHEQNHKKIMSSHKLNNVRTKSTANQNSLTNVSNNKNHATFSNTFTFKN